MENRNGRTEVPPAPGVAPETGWQPMETERRIRVYLWLSHGHKGVYGDDGEMQCGECLPFGAYDYKREPLGKLMDVLDAWGLARMKAALAAPPARPLSPPQRNETPMVSEVEVQSHVPWCRSRRFGDIGPFIIGDCNCNRVPPETEREQS